MERVEAKLLETAYKNYLTYTANTHEGAVEQLRTYLKFKKLINFEESFSRTDEGDNYSSHSKWYHFTDETANLIRLLASPHYHAIIKAKLALVEALKDDENINE
jgi:hypothetical protein